MQKESNVKILMTGGHFTTALAVLDALRKKNYTRFLWAGHKYSMLHDKEPSFEYKEVSKHGIPFSDIKAGKLYRYPSWTGVISFLRIPVGFIQSFWLVMRKRPTVVVSFGGYLAVPIAFSAWLFRIPVITHEQTVVSGLANKVLAKVARKVLLAWPSSMDYFPKDKAILTGNPIRKEVFTTDRKFVDFGNRLPTILVMGGNQGSHRINMVLEQALPELLKIANIIHQTGSNTLFNDYEKLKEYEIKYQNYRVFQGIWGDDYGRAIHQADFVITRSGANTTYELAALQKFAILIPLPFAYQNEQFQNALMLVRTGLGQLLLEKDLNAENLVRSVRKIMDYRKELTPKHLDVISERTGKLIVPEAAAKIADIVSGIIKEEQQKKALKKARQPSYVPESPDASPTD